MIFDAFPTCNRNSILTCLSCLSATEKPLSLLTQSMSIVVVVKWISIPRPLRYPLGNSTCDTQIHLTISQKKENLPNFFYPFSHQARLLRKLLGFA